MHIAHRVLNKRSSRRYSKFTELQSKYHIITTTANVHCLDWKRDRTISVARQFGTRKKKTNFDLDLLRRRRVTVIVFSSKSTLRRVSWSVIRWKSTNYDWLAEWVCWLLIAVTGGHESVNAKVRYQTNSNTINSTKMNNWIRNEKSENTMFPQSTSSVWMAARSNHFNDFARVWRSRAPIVPYYILLRVSILWKQKQKSHQRFYGFNVRTSYCISTHFGFGLWTWISPANGIVQEVKAQRKKNLKKVRVSMSLLSPVCARVDSISECSMQWPGRAMQLVLHSWHIRRRLNVRHGIYPTDQVDVPSFLRFDYFYCNVFANSIVILFMNCLLLLAAIRCRLIVN